MFKNNAIDPFMTLDFKLVSVSEVQGFKIYSLRMRKKNSKKTNNGNFFRKERRPKGALRF